MSAEQGAIAKGLVESSKVIKAPKRAGARAKKARIDYDDDLDENDDDDDFDDDYAHMSISLQSRQGNTPDSPISHRIESLKFKSEQIVVIICT